VWVGGTGGVQRINGVADVVGALEPYGLGTARDITYGLWAASSTAVFAAGSTPGEEGVPSRDWVRAWDGASWRDISPTVAFGNRRVTGFSPTQVFVRGPSGAVLRWDGARWNSESIGVSDVVQDLVALPSGVLLAVTNTPRNARRRSTAGVWSAAGWSPPTGLVFQRAWGRAENEVYATRYYGPGTYLWRWDGIAWSELPMRAEYLDDIAGNADGDVTAVGTLGRAWRYGRR
jgi:hypothetical protein